MQEEPDSRLSSLVSVVIAPREKHSTLVDSLASLFSTIPADVPVIACLPALPPAVREDAQQMMAARGHCQLEEFEPDLIPHRARALGAARVTTPWLVFADNDLAYEAGWLEALASAMQSGEADVLAPLIFIGPPAATTIHHAGGKLLISPAGRGKVKVREQHRLMNTPLNALGVEAELQSTDFQRCDVAEFHCLALRTELLKGTLTLPECLITREQQDLALQCQQQGLKVGFVAGARVTYMARTAFSDDDLRYHAARWSRRRASESLDYMESTWHMDFNRYKVLYLWIQKHRRRPFKQRGPKWLQRIPAPFLGGYLSRKYGYRV